MEITPAKTDYSYVVAVLSPDYWVTTTDVQRRLRRNREGILDCLHAAAADGVVECEVTYGGGQPGARYQWRRRA